MYTKAKKYHFEKTTDLFFVENYETTDSQIGITDIINYFSK